MKKETKPTPTYEEAITELEAIVSTLRSEKCDVDTLAQKAQRATELIKYCRSKLTGIDQRMREALRELDDATNS